MKNVITIAANKRKHIIFNVLINFLLSKKLSITVRTINAITNKPQQIAQSISLASII